MRAYLTKRQIIGASMLVVMAGSYFLLDHISVSLTPSLDYRVFWRSAEPRHKATLAKGSYAVFDAEKTWEKGAIREGKLVACAPGDKLVVDDMRDSYCNGVYLGHAKVTTSKGFSVKAFQYNGIVPKDHFYMIGTHRDSYDSRYYGFVSRNRILEVAWPLL